MHKILKRPHWVYVAFWTKEERGRGSGSQISEGRLSDLQEVEEEWNTLGRQTLATGLRNNETVNKENRISILRECMYKQIILDSDMRCKENNTGNVMVREASRGRGDIDLRSPG